MDGMNVSSEFLGKTLDELEAILAGGSLTIYSVARPANADQPVERSGILANFTFAAPAFVILENGTQAPAFVDNPVPGLSVGVPGFARARTADGTVVADFSAGSGEREVKFAEVSCSTGAPARIVSFTFNAEGGWPEKPEYYTTRPRTGYQLPSAP
jgi:hypothetical protein